MRTTALEKYLKTVSADFADAEICGAAVDSRLVRPGMIFFACRGSKSDGNRFAQNAIENGASVAVMDDAVLYKELSGNKVLVKNTIDSIYAMGKARLNDTKAIKIAVTGSFGKTTTKEMLKLVLERKYRVHATEGNHNNLLGVSLTACGMPDDIETAVFEVGTNAIGEIKELGALIRPDIAVLTGYGYAHVGNFKELSYILREKLSLVDGLAGMRTVVANVSFKEALELKKQGRGDKVVLFGEGTDVALNGFKIYGSDMRFTASVFGEDVESLFHYPYPHLAENFLAAFAVGFSLGMTGQEIASVAEKYTVPVGRGSITETQSLTIIDDAYNASLDSVLRAIEALELMPCTPKYALIGEIGEIEGHEHRIYSKIMERAERASDIQFIFGGNGYQTYKSKGNIKIVSGYDNITAELDRINDGTLLIKASHSYNFAQYVSYMKTRMPQDKVTGTPLSNLTGGSNAV